MVNLSKVNPFHAAGLFLYPLLYLSLFGPFIIQYLKPIMSSLAILLHWTNLKITKTTPGWFNESRFVANISDFGQAHHINLVFTVNIRYMFI